MRRTRPTHRRLSTWLAPAAGLWLALSAMTPAPAAAQDEATKAAGRRLAQDGLVAAQEGRCEEAVAILTRAKAIVPVPSVLVPLGECQAKLGKIVAGTENLQIAARAVLGDEAPQAFQDAQKRAREVLPGLLAQLGRIRVVVDGAPADRVTVEDNGDTMATVLLGVERPADPGKHSLKASAPGFLDARQEATVETGKLVTVVFELQQDPNAAPAVVAPLPTTPAPASSEPPSSAAPPPGQAGPPTWLVPAGAVSLGIGGGGLVFGSLFGLMASSKQSDLDAACPNKVCPSSSQGDIDDMSSFATVSTVGFVVGGVGIAAGAVMLAVGLSGGSSSSETAKVDAVVGPGFTGVQGRF